jgi:hypothetical protein
MWKEAAVAQFKSISRNFTEWLRKAMRTSPQTLSGQKKESWNLGIEWLNVVIIAMSGSKCGYWDGHTEQLCVPRTSPGLVCKVMIVTMCAGVAFRSIVLWFLRVRTPANCSHHRQDRTWVPRDTQIYVVNSRDRSFIINTHRASDIHIPSPPQHSQPTDQLGTVSTCLTSTVELADSKICFNNQ